MHEGDDMITTNIDSFGSALLKIADTTSDPRMAAKARCSARQLCTVQSDELEQFIKSARDELDWYKSDYRDSFDQSVQTQFAIQTASGIAKQAINAIIRLRQNAS
jgi:hypothetical protein